MHAVELCCSPSRMPHLPSPSPSLRSTAPLPLPAHPLPHQSQSDAGIPNLSPGNPTLQYFAEKRQQLKFLNAALLAALSLAARAVDAASVALIGVPAGCLSVLLLVSTAALGTRQVGGRLGVWAEGWSSG